MYICNETVLDYELANVDRWRGTSKCIADQFLPPIFSHRDHRPFLKALRPLMRTIEGPLDRPFSGSVDEWPSSTSVRSTGQNLLVTERAY